jgi:uncharacterized membrane protein
MNRPRNLFFLSGLFVFAGLMHFVIPGQYASIMPPWVPYRMEAVYLSGVCEIAGGLGLLMPSLRRPAGFGLIALLVAVFPANIQMLINSMGSHTSGLYQAFLWLRLPLQPLLIVWVWKTTKRDAIQLPRTNL